jgi:ABC-type dipeptide/oligopeptide/nickel transport system permease subunit
MRVNFCKNSLPLEAPSFSHWFGTNVRGYDIFSRTLFGSQAAKINSERFCVVSAIHQIVKNCKVLLV